MPSSRFGNFECRIHSEESRSEDVSRDERADGWYASDILGGNRSIVDVLVDELVLGVGGVVSDLNLVVELVVPYIIGAEDLLYEVGWDAT